MKNLLIVLLAWIFVTGCKDKPEPNIAALLIGNWKLSEYKQENQEWKDSTGTFLKFINDSLVSTKKFDVECDRKYRILESNEGLKQIIFPIYYPDCYFHNWYSFAIVAINKMQMEITYLDEIGGAMVRKNEKYLKE